MSPLLNAVCSVADLPSTERIVGRKSRPERDSYGLVEPEESAAWADLEDGARVEPTRRSHCLRQLPC
jgi:hypothetical protein